VDAALGEAGAAHGTGSQAGLRSQLGDRGQPGGDLAVLDLLAQPGGQVTVGVLWWAGVDVHGRHPSKACHGQTWPSRSSTGTVRLKG
jgi:hypothetical protein